VGGLGPPEITGVVNTGVILKVHADGVMVFQLFHTGFMLFYVKIRKIIDPVVYTRICIVVSYTLCMKIENIKVFRSGMVIQGMKSSKFIKV
jgi:hypothetical protein